jgi:hypothetical protein
MGVTIIRDPQETFALDIDARATTADLQGAHVMHAKRSLLGGRKASGGALPPNKAGKPLGQGDGSIATLWEVSQVSGDRVRAEATSAPGQQGGLYYAVQTMLEADANPASIEGEAAVVIDRVVNEHADRAIR